MHMGDAYLLHYQKDNISRQKTNSLASWMQIIVEKVVAMISQEFQKGARLVICAACHRDRYASRMNRVREPTF